MRRHLVSLILAALSFGTPLGLTAQDAGSPTGDVISGLRWRPIGPANMSGRITDVEGIPSPSKTFFVAA
ncbi:MAG: hypothetical protein ACWGSQ_20500, partial [Longimicrobiales bacterium]